MIYIKNQTFRVSLQAIKAVHFSSSFFCGTGFNHRLFAAQRFPDNVVRGCKSFPISTSHFKILGERRVKRSKFHIAGPQIFGSSFQNLVTTVTWRPGFVHSWCTSLIIKGRMSSEDYRMLDIWPLNMRQVLGLQTLGNKHPVTKHNLQE
jgi:hypothetical protein